MWTEDSDTCKVWVTMLAIANKHGEVEASIPGLAQISGVPLQKVEEAIAKFLAPDKYSRTTDDEGRRIEVIEGGWSLLNHAKYREMASKEESKAANAARQQRFRDKKARNAANAKEDVCAYCGELAAGVDHIQPKSKGGSDDPANLVRSCKRCNSHKASQDLVSFLNDHTLPFKIDVERVRANPKLSRFVTLRNGKWNRVTVERDIAEAEAEADTSIKEPLALLSDDSDEITPWMKFWNAYPQSGRKRSSRSKVQKAWLAVKPPSDTIEVLEAWKSDPEWTKENGQFVPAPDRWLRERRWEDSPSEPSQNAPQEPKEGAIRVAGRTGYVINPKNVTIEDIEEEKIPF